MCECCTTAYREVKLTRIPLPLSCIWSSFNPPSLTVIRMDVEPASRLFSSSSLRADDGLCMIYSMSTSRGLKNGFKIAHLPSSDAIYHRLLQPTDRLRSWDRGHLLCEIGTRFRYCKLPLVIVQVSCTDRAEPADKCTRYGSSWTIVFVSRSS